MVFYEALCPDSKNFIVKQLEPAFVRAPHLIDIQFVPYGKASVSVLLTSTKRYKRTGECSTRYNQENEFTLLFGHANRMLSEKPILLIQMFV